ncbi:hypothetical protein FS749_006691 [Ceratobasidium sp. UAMH 11750]|nr:hypothetical protein FS749_006691 [Ceratobasidium sp. UAMH 11750]
MFQDIKHDANRVQDKLRRVFRSREPGTSATGPVIGDPGMHVPQPDPRNDIPLPHLPTATVPPDGAWRPNLAAAASVPATAKRNFKNTPWAGLKTLLDVLNASTDAFSPLKSAVGGFVRCIEIYDNQASAREGYDKLGTQLNDLCQDISGYLGGVAPPGMTPSITSLARGIEEEVQRILRKSQRNAIERYAGAMEDADEILGCYLRIQMHLGRLALNANLNTWKIVDAQATDSRIARLPYSSAAEYRSAESSDLGRNGCTANTRMDLLKHLRMWAEDNKSQRIYWLNGMAGTGKTTVAYSLCEAIENTGKLAASFFCSRQSPECRDVGRILPSIAYQLSLFSRPFRYAISKVLEGNPRAHNQLPKEQFESLIATPLREIGHTLPSDLVIVIDALDECDSASGMNQILTALLTHAPNLPVKVFVTSRPNPNILDQMRSEQAERVRSELRLHELERLVVQSDIKTYLNAELGRLEPLKSTDIDQLVERSGVLFVYAATVVRYLADDNFSRGAQRLKDVLAATTSANGTHEEVDALYTAILEAALDREGVHISEREEMIRVLHTVICAQEPLSVNDIAGLLGLTTESVHANLRPFLSVLQISDSTGLVTTLHESFPDYLFNVERSKQFYCDARRQNAWFTRACFALLKALDPPFNICNLESSYLLDEEVPDLQNRVRNNISPHLFYACRYWEAHIEAAEPSERLNELFDFLSTRLLLWVEIMNLKRDIQGCVGMMSKLNTWLTVRALR